LKYPSFSFDIDSEYIGLLMICGKYNPKTTQIPNCMPYDPSRYMHRHRGKGKK